MSARAEATTEWGRGDDFADLAAEVTELLSRLLQADTSNPPGDSRPAAAVLRDYLSADGVPVSDGGEWRQLPFSGAVVRLHLGPRRPRHEEHGRRLFAIHAGEKGYANLRLTLRGRGGHGSQPQHEGSVVAQMAAVIRAIETCEPEVVASRLPSELIAARVADAGLRDRLRDPARAREALRDLRSLDGDGARLIEPQLGLTFAVTRARLGERVGEGLAAVRRDSRTAHPSAMRFRLASATVSYPSCARRAARSLPGCTVVTNG